MMAAPRSHIMPTYLVRLIEGHDLVGIFVAPSVLALAMLVDECTDPGGCEYQRMKPGGVMWTSPAVPVPIEDDEDADDFTVPDPLPWSGASLTESWWASLYEFSNKRKWHPIEFGLEDLYGIDPEEPVDPPPKPAAPTGAARILPYRKRDK
jgi:hypothetical protein